MAKKVVVVGGGSGGLVAARMVQTEATRLGGDIDVTLISASEKHYMPPLWSEVALGTASPEETWAPIKNAERAYGFKVVVDPVKTFDLPGKKVTTEGGQTFDFDYLVIALGTAYGWSDYKGLDKYGYHNYSEEGALELKKALSTYKGKKVVFLVPELPFRCGIYPPEMAMNVRAYLENRGVHPEISVLYPADAIRKMRGALQRRGFRFLHVLSPCPTGWKSEPGESIELLRLAVRSGLYPVYEIFDGDRVVINVEPEMSEQALERYFASQRRFRTSRIDLAQIRADIEHTWRRLRARVG